MRVDRENIQPFLRWAGGKSWFIKYLHKFLPQNQYSSYHEPFLGGGSVFFNLQPQKCFLSDLNEELIKTYIQVRDNVESVIKILMTFKNTEAFYYYLRDEKKCKDADEEAARFIFLNQTSFNGIYRVNLKGRYNVPYGFRSKNFYQPENLRLASKALENANIFSGDFTLIMNNINEGDLVFLDPPYTVSHYNNGFIKYNSRLFSEEDQIRLSNLIKEIKRVGAYYIMTNAAHDQVYEIFKDNQDKFVTEERASLIGGKNSNRGIYKEAIYTNVIK